MRQLTILLLFLSLQACAQMTITPVMQGFTPSLVLDFTKGTLPAGLTFTRSSIATRVNAAGNIETVAADQPRFDHDPITLQARGILIEESRTNLLSNSGFTLGSDGATPTNWISRGQVSGVRVTESTAVGANYVRITSNGGTTASTDDFRQAINTLTANAQYTVSFYARRVSGSGNTICAFVGATFSQLLTTSWVRYSFQATATGTAHNLFFGGQAGAVYDVANVQLEAGSFATSYIPTTSSSVTRAADVCLLPAGAWYNKSEGAWYGAFDLADRARYPRIVGMDGANFLAMSPGGYEAYNGSTTIRLANTQYVLGTPTRMLTCYGSGTVTVSAGGALASGAGSYPTTYTTFALGGFNTTGGSFSYGSILNGHISKIVYYPKRLPNTYLQSLTQ